MILVFIFILISIITTKAFEDRPSYRSSVMEGDKPILRMSIDTEEPYSDEENGKHIPLRTAAEAKTVKDLSLLVGWLVENLGYKVEPQGRRSQGDESLDIQVNEEPINQPPALRKHKKNKKSKKHRKSMKTPKSAEQQSEEKETALNENPSGKADDPSWVPDLKDFLSDLVTRIGETDLNRYTVPVIQTIEKKHNVIINDIDVDQYGDIYINYAAGQPIQAKSEKSKKKHTDKHKDKVRDELAIDIKDD